MKAHERKLLQDKIIFVHAMNLWKYIGSHLISTIPVVSASSKRLFFVNFIVDAVRIVC
jgi:hypothetical protein